MPVTGSLTVSQLVRPMIRVERLDHLFVAFIDRTHHDAIDRAAIILGDDDILRRIDQLAGEIAGVSGLKSRVCQTFARAMG